jgi:hypothetical protein
MAPLLIVSFLQVQLLLDAGVPYSAVTTGLIPSESDGDPRNIKQTVCSTTCKMYLVSLAHSRL